MAGREGFQRIDALPRCVPGVSSPKVRVSGEAYEMWQKWGMSDELLMELTHEIMEPYEYGHCVERLQHQLTERHIYLAQVDRFFKRDKVVLPFWYNVAFGYGQCGELTVQLETNQRFINWLEDANLEAHHLIGEEERVFCKSRQQHVVVGVTRKGDMSEILYLDPSYGLVTTEGFRIDREVPRDKITQQIAEVAQVGDLVLKGRDGFEIRNWEWLVLGITSSREGVAAIGWAREMWWITQIPRIPLTPVVKMYWRGGRETMTFMDPRDRRRVMTNVKRKEMLPETWKEIRQLLRVAQKYGRYETDLAKFPHALWSEEHGMFEVKIHMEGE